MQLRSGKTYVYINFNRFVHYNKYIDIFIIKCLNYLNDIDNANKCYNNYVKNIKKIEELIKFYEYIFNNLSDIISNYDKINSNNHPNYNSLNRLFKQVLITTPIKLLNDLSALSSFITEKDKMLKRDITDLLNVIIFRIKNSGYTFS